MRRSSEGQPRSRLRLEGLIGFFAVALLVPGVSVVLHELGHFGAHAAFGYEVNRLSYAGVSTGDPPAGVDPRLADGVSFAAGTLVSVSLLVLGVLSIVVVGVNPLGLGLVLFECVRAVMSFAVGVGSAGWGRALMGGFGELRYLPAAFGGPTLLGGSLAWIEAALPFAALAFVSRRMAPGTRLTTSGAVLVGLIGGMALWFLVVGPRVLPS